MPRSLVLGQRWSLQEPGVRRRHFHCLMLAPHQRAKAHGHGADAHSIENSMAQFFGIKTPLAAFMADSPILLA